MRSLLVLLCLATPAMAQDTVDADAFDAHVTGRTITFRTETNPAFGVEAYLPNRRVMWSTFDGTCMYGVWYEEDGDICFQYDDNPEPQCWAITLEDYGIRGVFTNVPFGTIIFEKDHDAPLICNDLSS